MDYLKYFNIECNTFSTPNELKMLNQSSDVKNIWLDIDNIDNHFLNDTK